MCTYTVTVYPFTPTRVIKFFLFISFILCWFSTSWRTSTLWSIIGFILLVAVTALLFRDWSTTKERNYWHPNMQRLDLVLAAAAVSLVTTLIYLVDLLATIRFGVSGELE